MAATKRHNTKTTGSQSQVDSAGKGYKFKHRTSIGRSVFSRPTNKHKRRSWKKYRGQGR